MAKIFELNEDDWQDWVLTRPPIVQKLCEKLKPNLLYRMKSTKKRVTIHGYSENGTVIVNVSAKYNFVVFQRQVFDVNPDDLEECNLPDKNEQLGAVLQEEEQIDQFIDQFIKIHNQAKAREN